MICFLPNVLFSSQHCTMNYSCPPSKQRIRREMMAGLRLWTCTTRLMAASRRSKSIWNRYGDVRTVLISFCFSEYIVSFYILSTEKNTLNLSWFFADSHLIRRSKHVTRSWLLRAWWIRSGGTTARYRAQPPRMMVSVVFLANVGLFIVNFGLLISWLNVSFNFNVFYSHPW